MAENKNLKLGEILLEERLITPSQLLEGLQVQKTDTRKLGEILVGKGYATEHDICRILSRVYGLPFVNLSETDIDEKVFGLVPAETLKKYHVIPLRIENQTLTLATNNPLDLSALQEIQYIGGYQVRPVIAAISDIEEHLEKFTETIRSVRTQHISREASHDVAPIIKLVESLLGRAIGERASDVHLEPMKDCLRVRFRIDGSLYEKTPVSKDLERKVISRIKILSGMDVADSRRPQDGRMSVPGSFKDYDIRVSTLPNIMGENMVLRILDKSFTDFSFESLGMVSSDIDQLKKFIQRPYGMILVTGPTGAGKSTTLYAILNTLNRKSDNIITVEDPVEYRLEGINQTAINTRIGYTFATAIRHILRHDPDIIMVGEIRDMETAEISIRAALTGHLVLSTLHTNTASGAVMRLLDMGIEPFLIQSSLVGVVAQRLVRRLCQRCKKEYKASDEIKQIFKKFGSCPDDLTLASPIGCNECFDTGYSGRAAIYEILPVTEHLRSLILKTPNETEITRMAVSRGMKTLRHAGLEKAAQKITSLEEVLSITFSEED